MTNKDTIHQGIHNIYKGCQRAQPQRERTTKKKSNVIFRPGAYVVWSYLGAEN